MPDLYMCLWVKHLFSPKLSSIIIVNERQHMVLTFLRKKIMTQTAAKITHLPAFTKLKEVVEEVSYQEIPGSVKKKVVVVYNHFNIEAILASAILKQCYNDFKIINIAQNIPSEGDLYVWLGVDQSQMDVKAMLGKKEHMTYSTHDQKEADEIGRRPSIIDQVCLDFMVRDTERLIKISFLASRFYMSSQQDMALNDLAYIYNEMKNAVAVLNGVQRPYMSDEEVVAQYLKDVKIIQAQFRDNYKQVAVAEGRRYEKVIYTTFSDHNFVLALRLMKLAHANFINHTNGLNGQLVYSNLESPDMGIDEGKVILLN